MRQIKLTKVDLKINRLHQGKEKKRRGSKHPSREMERHHIKGKRSRIRQILCDNDTQILQTTAIQPTVENKKGNSGRNEQDTPEIECNNIWIPGDGRERNRDSMAERYPGETVLRMAPEEETSYEVPGHTPRPERTGAEPRPPHLGKLEIGKKDDTNSRGDVKDPNQMGDRWPHKNM